MEITEIVNKGPVVKNKKISLSFHNLDIILSILREKKEKIRNSEDDLPYSNYSPKSWEEELTIAYYNNHSLMVQISEVQAIIESCILEHQRKNILTEPFEITITYEQFELLDNILSEKRGELEASFKLFGHIFLKEEAEICSKIINIQSNYQEQLVSILKKLYPYKEKAQRIIADYLDECFYNEEFVPSYEEITLHIPMWEKDEILLNIDKFITDVNMGLLDDFAVNHNEDDAINISSKEAANILVEVSKRITYMGNQLFSGSRFKINIRDYFIFKGSIDYISSTMAG